MEIYEINGVGNDSLVIVKRRDLLELLLNKSENQMMIRIPVAELIRVTKDMQNGATSNTND